MAITNRASTMKALVTGATGGIGRATCLELNRAAQARGQRLVLAAAASKPGGALDELVAELTAQGIDAHPMHADLADAAACARLAAEAVECCDGLDVLVSNAGIVRGAPLAMLDVADWDTVFAIDVRATWLLARGARAALAQSRGAIVAIASVASLYPFPGLGAYSPAKAALGMLCRQLAQEWAADGIRVNTVSPGLIRTPLTEPIYRNEAFLRRREEVVPLGRIGTPDDVARAVAHLAGPDAGYVTGIDWRLDGGLGDHILAMIPGVPRSPAPS
ncbi:MAG: SDR family oxidoreductase [Burkholderiales bacterium]|nr:SDR family oxidoreductase [Burkholderiales bacterium]